MADWFFEKSTSESRDLIDKSTLVHVLLGASRQQAITWANVDSDLCRHMVSLRQHLRWIILIKHTVIVAFSINSQHQYGMENRDPSNPASQYHACRGSVDAWSQGISNHVIHVLNTYYKIIQCQHQRGLVFWNDEHIPEEWGPS